MITFFLFALPIYSLTPKDIFVGEWDVHAGSSSDHEVAIKYSFEFHTNKTSGKTIATIWHSNIVSTDTPESNVEPMIAQFEISFEDDFEGTIYYNDNIIKFELKSLENERFYTKINIDFKKIYVLLKIIQNKVMEISIGPLDNDNQIAEANFVAYKAQPIQLVKILPIFQNDFPDERIHNKNAQPEYTLPKSGATFSDYVKYYTSKVIRYFYLYKPMIYSALFILAIQVISCMFLCSRAKKPQDYQEPHEKEVDETKDKDHEKEEEKNDDDEEDKESEEK